MRIMQHFQSGKQVPIKYAVAVDQLPNGGQKVHFSGGLTVFLLNGQIHNETGPAVKDHQLEEWWIHDHYLTPEEYWTYQRLWFCDVDELLLYVSEPIYAPIFIFFFNSLIFSAINNVD